MYIFHLLLLIKMFLSDAYIFNSIFNKLFSIIFTLYVSIDQDIP